MKPHDPRMRGFKRRSEVADVVKLLLDRVKPLPSESTPITFAAGRVLATDVVASVDLPSFDRAAMDGFALRGEETFGATEYSPIAFTVIGDSMPGRAFEGRVEKGQAVRIMTGAPMPAGADAVLMAEDAVDSKATAAVAPGKNVSKAGEDVRAGQTLMKTGRALRPQDVGLLAALGLSDVAVLRHPKVDIIATGNELLPPGRPPMGHKIVDANSPMLAALVKRDGGDPHVHPIARDEEHVLESLLAKCRGDVVLISGGSSVGIEDHAPRVVERLGELAIHGVAMRPSSPAGIGFIGGKPVFLLPGNPVSCLCAYDFFAGLAIRVLGGRPKEWPYRSVEMKLAKKVASEAGRVDYLRVTIEKGKAVPLMISGAGILSSTVRADGFVVIPRDSEGLRAGATVTVFLYG